MLSKRKIIEIDEDKCDGCGLCVTACHEGALKIIDGKAKVVNEVFCDGLGDCIGECPQHALTIIEREAPAFDEEAVEAHLGPAGSEDTQETEACGCPSSKPLILRKTVDEADPAGERPPSLLSTWPVQWRLIQPAYPFLKDADLILTADCVPVAMRDFHGIILRGRPVIVGCPKLDDRGAFLEKLVGIIESATPRSLTIARMEVPCCRGLTSLVDEALRRTGAKLPVREIVVSIKGDILEDSG
jgi:NAD-dependent dihydropyrimidine dehydrogenase PreA subunit